jgi:hypothetical protein
MAIIITPEIRGQECNENITYSYLFEPLRINVEESNPSATKLFVEIERYNIVNKTVLVPFEDGSTSLPRYVDIDLIPGRSVSFDLSEVMQQLHIAGVYKVATIAEIETSYEEMICSKYIYLFKVTSDLTTTPTIIKKLPILGGRDFGNFSSTVPTTQVLNEYEYYGIDQNELAKKWANYMFYKVQLKDPTSGNNLQPVVSLIPQVGPEFPNGGVLYWKSRFGGWMWWGFDIEERNSSGSYEGSLEVSMFESTKEKEGEPYIPVDYVSVSSNYTVNLKSIGLTQTQLLAVSGIDSSPAIYYAADNSGKLELMRLASSTTPYKNQANGGDFSVSLKSISKTSQKTA